MRQKVNDEYKRARHYALNRLAAQSYHSVLLTKLMKKKEFSSEIISKVIEECVRLGFLNDDLWVENFIRSRQNKWGPPIIMAKLRSKGIYLESSPIEVDEESEKRAILKLLQGRYRSKDLKSPPERQKVIAALMRKGFSWDSISNVLRQ